MEYSITSICDDAGSFSTLIFILMTYTPIQSKLPYLQVPENRLNLAFNWYSRQKDHPLNFPCYAYWIQQCENDGSDY
jgi:hypothetical protein